MLCNNKAHRQIKLKLNKKVLLFELLTITTIICYPSYQSTHVTVAMVRASPPPHTPPLTTAHQFLSVINP